MSATAQAQPPEFYAADFKQKGWEWYGTGNYRYRNLVLAEMIKKLQPKHIFEFAGAEGDLTEMLLRTCPTIEYYKFSDFCSDAVEHVTKHFDHCGFNTPWHAETLDIDKAYKTVPWHQYDLIVSTALEHIVNDTQIIDAIPKGTRVALCLPQTLWEGHVRAFPTWASIKERYPSLRFIDAVAMTFSAQDYNRKYLFTAEKR